MLLRSFNFESDDEEHVNGDELSELSDEFDDIAEPDDLSAAIPVESIALDDVTYDRDLKWVNKPNGARGKPTIAPRNKILQQVQEITKLGSTDLAELDQRYSSMEEKRRIQEKRVLVEWDDAPSSRRREARGTRQPAAHSGRGKGRAEPQKPTGIRRREHTEEERGVNEDTEKLPASHDEEGGAPRSSRREKGKGRGGRGSEGDPPELKPSRRERQRHGGGEQGRGRPGRGSAARHSETEPVGLTHSAEDYVDVPPPPAAVDGVDYQHTNYAVNDRARAPYGSSYAGNNHAFREPRERGGGRGGGRGRGRTDGSHYQPAREPHSSLGHDSIAFAHDDYGLGFEERRLFDEQPGQVAHQQVSFTLNGRQARRARNLVQPHDYAYNSYDGYDGYGGYDGAYYDESYGYQGAQPYATAELAPTAHYPTGEVDHGLDEPQLPMQGNGTAKGELRAAAAEFKPSWMK